MELAKGVTSALWETERETEPGSPAAITAHYT